jgi:hypothetical protein
MQLETWKLNQEVQYGKFRFNYPINPPKVLFQVSEPTDTSLVTCQCPGRRSIRPWNRLRLAKSHLSSRRIQFDG